jgi:hypothetical protein
MTSRPSLQDVRQAVGIEVIAAITAFADLDLDPQIGTLHDHLHQCLARHSLITAYWRRQPRRRQSALIDQALQDLQVFTPDGEPIRRRFYEIAWGPEDGAP